MPAGVVVLGDALLDVHVRPAVPPRPARDVPAVIRLGPGGQGANVAVRLGRRGVSTRLACAIGDDVAGRIVRDALAADGVEVHDLGAHRTGSVVVLLDPGGERTMLSHRAPVLERRGIDPRPLFDAAWLVVSGYVLLERAGGLSATGSTPVRVVLGCALDPRRVDDWVASAASLAPHLVVLNLDEARAVADRPPDPAALSHGVAARLRCAAVVTHDGGAVASLAGGSVRVDTRRMDSVDTTGAGDAFAAALVAELASAAWPPDEGALERAMRAGVDLAAAVAGVEGAQARVPGEPAGFDR
jgi:sugar/nucleoside kinase (ribokinase family)